jgi:hypothetical protein
MKLHANHRTCPSGRLRQRLGLLLHLVVVADPRDGVLNRPVK